MRCSGQDCSRCLRRRLRRGRTVRDVAEAQPVKSRCVAVIGLVLTAEDDRASVRRGEVRVLYAAIDIHKHAFQAAVLDPESGEAVEEHFSADREGLERWAGEWQQRVAAVAIGLDSGAEFDLLDLT
jgi:hypothetical protein